MTEPGTVPTSSGLRFKSLLLLLKGLGDERHGGIMADRALYQLQGCD